MVIFKESIIITCSSTSSDTHHVLWLVGVEAFAGSSWFIDTLVFSMESATREIKRRG